MQHRYFVVHKPVNMVSQFVSPHSVRLLGDLEFLFPEGTHAIGRLDSNSEGLLLLTTNKAITGLLLKPPHQHNRTYHVLVKGIVSPESIEKLQQGVSIQTGADEHYITRPGLVSVIESSPYPDTRGKVFFKSPETWLEITITEGKYHQVRKMVLAIGHRCRRLIRVSIEDLELGNLQPGEVREMNEIEFFEKLKI